MKDGKRVRDAFMLVSNSMLSERAEEVLTTKIGQMNFPKTISTLNRLTELGYVKGEGANWVEQFLMLSALNVDVQNLLLEYYSLSLESYVKFCSILHDGRMSTTTAWLEGDSLTEVMAPGWRVTMEQVQEIENSIKRMVLDKEEFAHSREMNIVVSIAKQIAVKMYNVSEILGEDILLHLPALISDNVEDRDRAVERINDSVNFDVVQRGLVVELVDVLGGPSEFIGSLNDIISKKIEIEEPVLDELTRTKRGLQMEIDGRDFDREQYNESIRGYNEEIVGLTKENTDLRDRVMELEDYNEELILTTQKKLEEAGDRVRKYEIQSDMDRNRISNLLSEIEAVKREVKETEERGRAKVQEVVKEANEKLSELHNEKESLLRDLTECQKKQNYRTTTGKVFGIVGDATEGITKGIFNFIKEGGRQIGNRFR